MNNNNNTNGGMGFFSVLTLIFIVLKLTDVIAWSWWYVLMPTWLPIAILLGIVVIGGGLWLAVKELKGDGGK